MGGLHRRRSSGLSRLALLLILVPACVAARSQAAQTPRPGTRVFSVLAAEVPQASGAVEVRELRIRWTSGTPSTATAGAPPIQTLSLAGEARGRQTIRRERRPELSDSHLVVVVQDARGRDLDWRIVLDPRILRAEVPTDPGGALTGRTFQRQDAELLVTVANAATAERLVLYSPRWTGDAWELDSLAQLRLPPSR